MTLLATAVVLRAILTPGAVHTYDVSRTYTNSKYQETTVFRERVSLFVESEVETGWFRIRRERTSLEAEYDSVKVPAPPGSTPSILREERSPRNTVRALDPEPPDAHWMERAARPLRVFFPSVELSLGDTWRHESPQNAARLPAWSAAWTLKALDEKTATVAIDFRELEVPVPVTAEGTVIFDRQSGWPVSLDVTVENVRVPDDEEPTPVSLRVQWRLAGKGAPG